jgi:hypothetical protein
VVGRASTSASVPQAEVVECQLSRPLSGDKRTSNGPRFLARLLQKSLNRVGDSSVYLTVCRDGWSAFAPPGVLQRLRAHSNVFGGVGDRGMTHQLAQPPRIHAAIGLYRASGMSEAVRMHRPGDLGVLSRCGNHLVDGEPRKGFSPFAGEDVGSFGLLLLLQSLQPNGFVAFEVMGAVDRAFEAPDGDGAFAEVDVIPAQRTII